MLDDDSPGLGVDFIIDTGASSAELVRLAAMMESTEAKVLVEANRIEKATANMVNLAGATASVQTFGNAATRELQSARQAMASTEKAGEAMARSLEKQNAAFGKTREEMRGAKAEAAALAAEQRGLTELAQRIRAQEGALYDKEFAAARRAGQAADAAAQDKVAAAQKAIAAAEREAQAVRSAARAYDMFEAVARQKMAIYREQQASDAATLREAEAVRARAAAEAAVNAQLLERSRIEAALERNTGVGRIRATDAGATFSALAARAAEDEARAQQLVASATKRAADEHARLAAAVQASHAAQVADAAAAEQLRASTDPLYAATKRLNAEIAESTRLYHAGATAPAEYARQQQVLTGRLREVEKAHEATATATGKAGSAARLGRNDMLNLGYQVNDLVVSLASGQKPLTVFIQQGAQIGQIAASAGVGIRGMAASVFALMLPFAPLIAVVAAAGAGLALLTRFVNQGVTNDQLTRDLGKITGGANATKQELYKLREETVTWGDTTKALFSVVGKDVAESFVGDMKGMAKEVKSLLDDMTSYGKTALASLYAGVAGTRAYLGELEKGGIGGLAKMALGQGDPKLLEKTFGAAYTVADTYLTKLGARVKRGAVENARERIAKTIGFNNEPKPRVDRHAEQLARAAAATEAQIRNLYALADAYRVSGAAALIAEARVKAESQAIKQRGDIEAAVAREIRLAIALRVSDAAKATAAMREQATAQGHINDSVAAGLVPAHEAAELVRDRIADLPLLAAIEAAQQIGNKQAIDKATQALADQRKVRADLTAEQRKEQFNTAMATGAERLDELREELRLVGATDIARVRALSTLRATQEAAKWNPEDRAAYIARQVEIATGQQMLTEATDAWNASLGRTSELFDTIDQAAQNAASGMASAFGQVGAAIGDVLTVTTGYYAEQARLQQAHEEAIRRAGTDEAAIAHENRMFAIRSASLQVGTFGDMAAAAKGFFKEGSSGYRALAAAEKAFRLVQFALSVRAIAQDAIETGSKLATSAARIATGATEAVVNAIKSLPFPLNLAAGAATAAALTALGVSVVGAFGGGGKKPEPSNKGTGTVLGDAEAKSESLKRSIDQLREVDTVTSVFARQMTGYLRSIDNQIGGFAAQIVRAGDLNASGGVNEGFRMNAVGSILSKIPLVGGILGGLFGTKTSVVGSGLYGGAQSIGSILAGGFDAQTFSDVQKKKKLFGITTSTKYSTQYAAADAGLENQFTLILRSFASAIGAAAGPLGEAAGSVEARLAGFVVNIGKIDLKDLTGTQIQEKLEAVFGAAADGMAEAAFPGVARFQKAGEGAFETLVRVASTLEAVSTSLDLLGTGARAMSIDAKLGLADQFDSIGDLASAVDGYFGTSYTRAEQAAARAAQMDRVFASLGISTPATLTAFRQLVEAQDLTTAAGQATYATLLQLAPAFAELQQALTGAKSAADVAAERQDLERKLLELRGDTAAIRALELAKLDASNRALQEEIYALQDAQEAAKAADELAKAWTSVGDSIMDEVRRIRGLSDMDGGSSFATLQGRFNAANAAARGGDIDAAKNLPALSQALLGAAADAATSRQELARVQAQTAAALEATYGVVGALTAAKPTSTTARVAEASASQGTVTAAANDDTAGEIRALREEVAGLRRDNNAGHAATAGNTGRIDRRIEDVTAASGGEAISVAVAA